MQSPPGTTFSHPDAPALIAPLDAMASLVDGAGRSGSLVGGEVAPAAPTVADAVAATAKNAKTRGILIGHLLDNG
jgi:hypothetical protein